MALSIRCAGPVVTGSIRGRGGGGGGRFGVASEFCSALPGRGGG